MSDFKEVISAELAEQEITAWVKRKKLLPSRMKACLELIGGLVESVQYGFLIINPDGTLKLKLIEPVCDDKGTPVLTELDFKARITPTEQNNAYAQLKGKDDITSKTKAITCLLTNQIPAMIDKLENQDRQIVDMISLFFTI